MRFRLGKRPVTQSYEVVDRKSSIFCQTVTAGLPIIVRQSLSDGPASAQIQHKIGRAAVEYRIIGHLSFHQAQSAFAFSVQIQSIRLVPDGVFQYGFRMIVERDLRYLIVFCGDQNPCHSVVGICYDGIEVILSCILIAKIGRGNPIRSHFKTAFVDNDQLDHFGDLFLGGRTVYTVLTVLSVGSVGTTGKHVGRNAVDDPVPVFVNPDRRSRSVYAVFSVFTGSAVRTVRYGKGRCFSVRKGHGVGGHRAFGRGFSDGFYPIAIGTIRPVAASHERKHEHDSQSECYDKRESFFHNIPPYI